MPPFAPRCHAVPNPGAEYGHGARGHDSEHRRGRQERRMARAAADAYADALCPAWMPLPLRPRAGASLVLWPPEPYGQPFPAALTSGAQDGPVPAAGRAKGGPCIDPALAAKARTDPAYGEFVSAVASALASPEAEPLGLAGYSFAEKSDPERPSWLKMILHIDFVGGDFDSKRGRRIRLREILNGRIGVARRRSGTPRRIDEMTGRFFITVGW